MSSQNFGRVIPDKQTTAILVLSYCPEKDNLLYYVTSAITDDYLMSKSKK